MIYRQNDYAMYNFFFAFGMTSSDYHSDVNHLLTSMGMWYMLVSCKVHLSIIVKTVVESTLSQKLPYHIRDRMVHHVCQYCNKKFCSNFSYEWHVCSSVKDTCLFGSASSNAKKDNQVKFSRKMMLHDVIHFGDTHQSILDLDWHPLFTTIIVLNPQ